MNHGILLGIGLGSYHQVSPYQVSIFNTSIRVTENYVVIPVPMYQSMAVEANQFA